MSRSSFGAIPDALPASKGSSGERAAACLPDGVAGCVAARRELRQAGAKRSGFFGASAASALAAEGRGAGILHRARSEEWGWPAASRAGACSSGVRASLARGTTAPCRLDRSRLRSSVPIATPGLDGR
jgi:hypothetical protein